MGTLADSTDANFDSADELWEQLAVWLERFAQAWQGDQRPAIADFVPAAAPAVRRLALAELIKLDLEYCAERGLELQRIEQYCAEFPELAEDGVPTDLLYEEYHVRRGQGEQVTVEDYLARFPDQADALRQLLQLDAPAHSTAMLAASPPSDLQPGDQLDDFDLLAELGKGAFARVFLARQRSLQRLVAVKISADRGCEPQTLARLDHPNIVRVYDQRVLPERGMRLLYMKCVSGGTLEQVIRRVRACEVADRSGRMLLEAVNEALDARGESIPSESAARGRLELANWPETVCRIGYQLAQALHYAHTAHGVLHRDLKPANILLTAEAVPQLVDFNISFCSKLDGATPAAYFGGSMAYMSPEQLEACNPTHPRSPESLEGSSDVYSLGVVLWELLSGARPFLDQQLSGSWTATFDKMVQSRWEGPDAETLVESAGPLRELIPILVRCLAADPAARYRTAQELADELRLCLQPAASQLVRNDPQGRIVRLRRAAMPILAAAALVPNAATGAFNYHYNKKSLLEDYQTLFNNVQLLINSVAFPLGVLLVLTYIRPVTQAVRTGSVADDADANQLASWRRRALKIGHFIALLAIAEWTAAALAYPALMSLGGAQLKMRDFVSFYSSLVLCGLVAAAYPYFFATAFTVRVVYPAFIEPFRMSRQDVADIDRLEVRTWLYLALGLLVPMLGVTLMVMLGAPQLHQDMRYMLAVVSGSSLAGFGLLVALARYLQRTATTLRQLTGVVDKRET